MVILDEPGSIVRERIDDTSGTLISAGSIILGALGSQGLALLHPLGGSILAGEITLNVNLAHIIHRGSDRRFDARIKRRGIDGHPAESADADDTDALRVNQITGRKEIYRSQEILGIDIRGCHPPGLAARFAGIGRVECYCNEAALGHMLGIEA